MTPVSPPESPPAPRAPDAGARRGHQPVGLQRQAGLAGRRGHHPQGAHPRHRRRVLRAGRRLAPGDPEDRCGPGGRAWSLRRPPSVWPPGDGRLLPAVAAAVAAAPGPRQREAAPCPWSAAARGGRDREVCPGSGWWVPCGARPGRAPLIPVGRLRLWWPGLGAKGSGSPRPRSRGSEWPLRGLQGLLQPLSSLWGHALHSLCLRGSGSRSARPAEERQDRAGS